MSVVEPDPVQAAEAGIELPTEDQKRREELSEAGQPVESGVDAQVFVEEKKTKAEAKTDEKKDES